MLFGFVFLLISLFWLYGGLYFLLLPVKHGLAKTLKYALCPFILPFAVFCDTVTVFSDLFAMICENKESRSLFLTKV